MLLFVFIRVLNVSRPLLAFARCDNIWLHAHIRLGGRRPRIFFLLLVALLLRFKLDSRALNYLLILGIFDEKVIVFDRLLILLLFVHIQLNLKEIK